MKATVSASFRISLLLLSFCCRPAEAFPASHEEEGENRLIGSDNPIIVAPGQDVILPCRLELEMDLLHKTIEWSKEGNKTEPARRRSWKTYVFLYRRGIQISAMMMQLYIQRTSLFDERLRHGDVSLKIMNVTLDDSGTYECFLPERDQRAKVQLVVSPDIPTSTTKMQLYFNSPTSFDRREGDSQRTVLSIRPNRSQFFQYDSFTVSCTADSSGWTVKRNTSVHVDQECHRSGGVPGESLCVIEMAYPSDTGVYWCENERGWSSNAVSISVTYAGVILESPPHPLTDGDNVTLSCFYKTETRRTATSDFTANFYKNGVLLGSGAAGRMTLTTVSRSDEGLYRCEHPDGEESEESWLTVRDRAQCGAAAPPLMSRTKLLISSLLFIFYNVLLILFFLKYRLWTREVSLGLTER